MQMNCKNKKTKNKIKFFNMEVEKIKFEIIIMAPKMSKPTKLRFT